MINRMDKSANTSVTTEMYSA